MLAHVLFSLLQTPALRVESRVDYQAQRLMDILRQERVAIVVVLVSAHFGGQLRAVVGPAFGISGEGCVPPEGGDRMIFRRKVYLKMMAGHKLMRDERPRLEERPGLHMRSIEVIDPNRLP